MAESARLIVSTRASSRDADMARMVSARGFRYRAIPATGIRRYRGAVGRIRKLISQGRFDWMVVTSRTAANILARAIKAGGRVNRAGLPSIAAVGPSTAGDLRRLGLRVPLVPSMHTGQALAGALLSGAVRRPRRVLWPRAAHSRRDLMLRLRRAGVEVVAPTIYAVTRRSTSRLATLDAALASGRVAAICFFAPSAVRAVAAALSAQAIERLRVICVASIGPTTTAALRAAGIEPVVEPRQATALAVGRAVVRFLNAERGRRR